MRRALGSMMVFMVGCGLFEGGPPGDFVADAAPDLALEDRGTMTTDSGQTCGCVLPDAEKDGWTYAGGQPASATCPLGFTGPGSGARVWAPQANGYSCGCTCAKTNPSCTVPGSLAFHYGAILCSASTSTFASAVTVGQCHDFDQGNLNGNLLAATVSVDGLSTQGGTCGPSSVMRAAGSVTTSGAQICELSAPKATCSNGNPCVPLPAAPMLLCVTKSDPTNQITMCPKDFPKALDGMAAGPTHVGTMTDDANITCPACTCGGGTGTCNFGVDVYDATNCNNNKLFTATAACQSDGQGTSGFRPRSFRVNANPQNSCAASYMTTAPMGTPSLTNAIAVCCR
jgi:hypothetical protein